MLTHSYLEISLASVVCISYILENNSHIKHSLEKKLKKICYLVSDKHLFFKYFQIDVFLERYRQNSQNILGRYWYERVNIQILAVRFRLYDTVVKVP